MVCFFFFFPRRLFKAACCIIEKCFHQVISSLPSYEYSACTWKHTQVLGFMLSYLHLFAAVVFSGKGWRCAGPLGRAVGRPQEWLALGKLRPSPHPMSIPSLHIHPLASMQGRLKGPHFGGWGRAGSLTIWQHPPHFGECDVGVQPHLASC